MLLSNVKIPFMCPIRHQNCHAISKKSKCDLLKGLRLAKHLTCQQLCRWQSKFRFNSMLVLFGKRLSASLDNRLLQSPFHVALTTIHHGDVICMKGNTRRMHGRRAVLIEMSIQKSPRRTMMGSERIGLQQKRVTGGKRQLETFTVDQGSESACRVQMKQQQQCNGGR